MLHAIKTMKPHDTEYYHRVDTHRAGTDRCKHCETYVFMYPLFSGDRAKNDQLRVLGKRVAIQWDACIW
jgi:hypothetical protein